MFSYLAELMYTGKPAKNGIVIYYHMSGKCGVIGKYDITADDTIMCNMNIGHDPVAVSNDCLATAMLCTAINRAIFPYDIKVTNLKGGIIVIVEFFVLGIITYRTELENPVRFANSGRAFNNDVRSYPGIISNNHTLSDDRIWPDRNVFTNPGIWINDNS
jgi:hypothetical protein